MTTKNKQPNTAKIHARRSFTPGVKVYSRQPSSKASRLSQKKRAANLVNVYARRTILIVIALAMMAVILAILFTSLSTPERIVTREVEYLAQDYYENYFYDRIGMHDVNPQPITDILTRYADSGFTEVSLRQLLYFDNDRHIDALPSLEAYCDLDSTSIKIFPDSPFGKTDYHVKYTYSCTF